jgi:hypothetical protein
VGGSTSASRRAPCPENDPLQAALRPAQHAPHDRGSGDVLPPLGVVLAPLRVAASEHEHLVTEAAGIASGAHVRPSGTRGRQVERLAAVGAARNRIHVPSAIVAVAQGVASDHVTERDGVKQTGREDDVRACAAGGGARVGCRQIRLKGIRVVCGCRKR